jgi:hypothetical protein
MYLFFFLLCLLFLLFLLELSRSSLQVNKEELCCRRRSPEAVLLVVG